MIVRMSRVTVVCRSADTKTTVARLRDLGVLHVVPSRQGVDGDVDAARRQVERLRNAITALPTSEAAPRADDAQVVADRVHAIVAESRELANAAAELEAERRGVEPFGDFDPEQARNLAEAGLEIHLVQYPTRGDRPAMPDGAVLEELGDQDGVTSAVAIAPIGASVGGRRVPLPARPLSAIRAALAANAARRAQLDAELLALAPARAALERQAITLEDELRLVEARAGMGSAEELSWIEGFCPEDAVGALTAAAAEDGFAVVARAPAPDEVVPTLLRSNAFVRQVHSVLEMIGIAPGYGEPDVSPAFLFFLVLFAGMLIGDAGYGALLLVIAFLAGRKVTGNPPQALRLLRTIGVATLLWGAVTGTWFAIPNLPAALDSVRIEWLAGSDRLATTRHVMLLCFFIGAVHITLAHLWAAARSLKSATALAQLGWIASTWCMFFVARTMVLGESFPSVVIPITVGGIAAIVLFMTPLRQLKSEWFNHVMLPLSLVSNFVDVVSYLRLFAVGSAGVAVAGAFNDMAARIGAGGGANILVAALVAVFGHTLNLLLCAMGVLVHGVRLNTLEFSAHLGMQWSGVRYEPLRRRLDPAGGAPDRSTN